MLLVLGAGGQADSREITYYNGHLGPVFAFYGPERSARFHPQDFGLTYPFQIAALMVEFYDGMGSFDDSMFWFKVYAGDGQTQLFQSETLWASRRNLDSVYLLASPLLIDSGDFYASLLSRTVSPWAKPYINYDDDSAPQHSFYGSPGAWQQWVDGGEYYLCAYVDTGLSQGIAEKHTAPARETRIVGLAPNPCAGSARVQFRISEPSRVSLRLCDVTGQTVAILADGVRRPGDHELVWDASRMPAGVYFLSLAAEESRALAGGHRGKTVSTSKLVVTR